MKAFLPLTKVTKVLKKKEKDNTAKLLANWQYPIIGTYKGLQLLHDGKSYLFKSADPIVDFILYKSFLIQRSSELGIKSVSYSQSFVDFLTLEDENAYRIGYFDVDGSRVKDEMLNEMSVKDAMSLFTYYICDTSIKSIDDLEKHFNNVREKANSKN